MNSQVAFFLNVVFKDDVMLMWLSFELLSGAEIVQDKFILIPRSERFVYDFSTGSTTLQEEQTEFWNIFHTCFEDEKKEYNSLESVFLVLHLIKPDGFFAKLTLQNIIEGKEKHRKEVLLLKSPIIKNSNNNSNNNTPQKRKPESNNDEILGELQKKKQQFSGSLVSNQVSDVEFVASIKKSEEWKESTPNKVVPQQKITVDNRRTTNNEVLSNINISEKVVPFEKTFDSLVKGNFNVASLEEMKKELFLKFSEKEKEKRVSLGPSTQQAPILANSFRQERTERERTDVHSPLIFENYENYDDPNKNETVDISFGRKVDTKLDDGEDSMEGVENSDGEIGFSGSDNFELASKSSGCCDACHMEFSKERKCVNFRFSEIDYNVCSICIKANSFKKKTFWKLQNV